MFVSIWTIAAFRIFTLSQIIAQNDTPTIQIGGYHVHHWQIALFFMPILLILFYLAKVRYKDKTFLTVIIILLFANVAMFVDGAFIGYWWIPK